MKYIIRLMLAMALGGCVNAQDIHDWNASFRIVDETGAPIKDAAVTVFYDPMALPGGAVDSGKITGLTDADGTFAASHHDRTYGLRFLVEKEGYYPTDIQDDFHGESSKRFPDKFNPDLNIVLKSVGNPTAMYAKWVRKNPPVASEPVGYDLTKGDWVEPYGKGSQTDIIFQADDYRHSGADYQHKVTLKFPKSGDGIQLYTVPDSQVGSVLRSPHEAPIDGYQSELTRETSAHSGQPSKLEYDPNRIYLFRVRTVLDSSGNIKSALYGKIYGDFMQFSYYLNPKANDRNIEFDPKQNLLGGLNSLEQVTAP